jgi:hypothetical protein
VFYSLLFAFFAVHDMDYPKIRAVSPIPVELPEGKFIYLQDPSNYATESVLLPPQIFSVVQFFNGKRSIDEIQRDYKKYYRTHVEQEDIRHIVEHLDQCFLMEGPAFEQHLQGLQEEFAALPLRQSSHKGAAYPEDKHELVQQLDSYFLAPGGPGRLPGTHEGLGPKAILAPHIDIKAGGPAFAWAYDALAASDADTFIILGTSHVGMKNFLALTRKNFETPFGTLESDGEFIDALCQKLPYNPFEDELIHKSEHSVEFQIVFLQYLQEKLGRAHNNVTIVPILCGGEMYEALYNNHPVQQVPQIEESIRALKQILATHEKACLVASVDFSHIGLRYGDAEAPDADTLTAVERVDRRLLESLELVDHQSFFDRLQDNCNATQVCGYAPMYTMMRLLNGERGRLLHYGKTELSSGSFVSFASMAWV